jgi:hypothetical protein
MCVRCVAGVRDVCGGLPVPGAESHFHRALGPTKQEESARVARATEQPQPAQLRSVQTRGVRQVPKRPAQDAKRQKRGAERASIALVRLCVCTTIL